MTFNGRVILIVLDSVGVGEAPDSKEYGDEGSNTFANTARAVGGIHAPNLAALGIGNLSNIKGVSPTLSAKGAFGRMIERSAGKDSTTGHWEIAGLVLDKPFPTYPEGFPHDVIHSFERSIGRRVLGNCAASGTEIIAELGKEHMRSGSPIVYTSADSVFQIAAHEHIINTEDLYEMCRKARDLLQGEHGVARVIARPFVGEEDAFVRTANRLDFSLPPPRRTVLDLLSKTGIPVIGIGKISDLFAGRGITKSYPTPNNEIGIQKTIELIDSVQGPALIFTNLVDFDSLYGHRNDPEGYAGAIEHFDRRLPDVINSTRPEDILIITADHGCDPTMPGTDHSRELVPLLITGDRIKRHTSLGLRESFADVAQTIADIFLVGEVEAGVSFLNEIVSCI